VTGEIRARFFASACHVRQHTGSQGAGWWACCCAYGCKSSDHLSLLSQQVVLAYLCGKPNWRGVFFAGSAIIRRAACHIAASARRTYAHVPCRPILVHQCMCCQRVHLPVCLPVCRDHKLINKGVGATSSGIFAACAEQMVPEVRLCLGRGEQARTAGGFKGKG